MKMRTFTLWIVTLLAAAAFADTLVTYHDLALKDLDQMVAIVKKKVKESREDKISPIGPLKEGVRLVYSRPDSDGMIDKVIGPLRNEIEDVDDWDKTLGELTEEAVLALQNTKGEKADEQITHVILLQNVIGTLKPRVKESAPKKMLEKIRDAHIELTKEAKNERRLRLMKETASPSEMADAVLTPPKKDE